jgi:flagellum-specific ATP synthase
MRARELWGEYERVRDLLEIGAYRAGTDARLDQAIAVQPRLEAFIRQAMGHAFSRADSLALLHAAFTGGEEAAA